MVIKVSYIIWKYGIYYANNILLTIWDIYKELQITIMKQNI